MVTKVSQLQDFTVEDVRQATGVRIDCYTLRSQGKGRRSSRSPNLDWSRAHSLATFELDGTPLAFRVENPTEKDIVLSNETRDEHRLRVFVEIVGSRDLLNPPVVEHRNPCRHR